jgi:isopenicillin N synthase-like dioxygenase
MARMSDDVLLPVDATRTAGALLPVIDIAAFERDSRQAAGIKEAVQRALTESGFMYIKGYGMDSALIGQAFAASRGFFDQPRAVTATDTRLPYS